VSISTSVLYLYSRDGASVAAVCSIDANVPGKIKYVYKRYSLSSLLSNAIGAASVAGTRQRERTLSNLSQTHVTSAAALTIC